jgi:hypothetical protein
MFRAFPAGTVPSTRVNGPSIATGIARRAQTPQFRGDLPLLFDRLKDQACSATSANVPPKIMKDFGTAADIARGG